MTKELEEEGRVREFIRNIKDLRKKNGLTQKDRIIIYCTFGEFTKDSKNYILKEAGADNMEIKKENEMSVAKREIKLAGGKHFIEIIKK